MAIDVASVIVGFVTALVPAYWIARQFYLKSLLDPIVLKLSRCAPCRWHDVLLEDGIGRTRWAIYMQADLISKTGFPKQAMKLAGLCNIEMTKYDQAGDVGGDKAKLEIRMAAKDSWMESVIRLYPLLFRPVSQRRLPGLAETKTQC